MKLADHFGGLISNRLAITKNIFTLLKLEAKLAGASIGPLLFSGCILLVLLLSLWITVLALLGYLLFLALGNFLPVLGFVLLLNAIFTVIAFRALRIRAQRISFAKTRSLLISKSP